MSYLKYTSAPPELTFERRNGKRRVMVEFNNPTILVDQDLRRLKLRPPGGRVCKKRQGYCRERLASTIENDLVLEA